MEEEEEEKMLASAVASFPFQSLHEALSEFLLSSHGRSMAASGELEQALASLRDELVNPQPLNFSPRSQSDRQAVLSGVIDLFGQKLPIPPEIRDEIIKLSDELDLNERDCVIAWFIVSNETERQKLERRLCEPLGSLRRNIPLATRRFIFYEKSCILACVRDLLKARLNESLPQPKLRVVAEHANSLMKQGLPRNLMTTIRMITTGDGAFSSSLECPSAAGPSKAQFANEVRVTAAESLFYIFYDTQALPDEVVLLVDLLQHVSGHLSSSLLAAAGDRSGYGEQSRIWFGQAGYAEGLPSTSHESTRQVAATEFSLRPALYILTDLSRQSSLLRTNTILLVTLACSLEQRNVLHDRDAMPVGSRNSFGKGNAIWPPPSAQSTEGAAAVQIEVLRTRIMSSQWPHRPTQGVVCLVWALFIAPAAARNLEDVEAVEEALSYAFNLRAFSFLRHAKLIPQRFTSLRGGPRDESEDFYLAVLADVTVGYLGLCCDVQQNGEEDLVGGSGTVCLGLPLPVSKQRHSQEVEFAVRHYVDSRGSSIHEPSELAALELSGSADCLEDLLLYMADICEACPFLIATILAPRRQTPNEQPARRSSLSSSRLGLRLLDLVAERVRGDDSCLAAYVRMLAGLAAGPAPCTWEVHSFLGADDTLHGWNFFLSNMDSLGLQLAPPRPVDTGSTSSPLSPSPPPASSAEAHSPKPPSLTPRVVELLVAFCSLLQRVLISSPDARSSVLGNDFRVLECLMTLLGCAPVPPVLKGALLKAMAAAVDPLDPKGVPTAQWIWERLESARVLHGLRQEIDTTEAMAKTYPALDGFLCLLERLVACHVPYTLGDRIREADDGRGRFGRAGRDSIVSIAAAGGSSAGISSYVEFLLRDVVLKAPARGYVESGERWRMTGRALNIFNTLLRRYHLGSLAPQELGLGGSSAMDWEQSQRDFPAAGGASSVDSRAISPYLGGGGAAWENAGQSAFPQKRPLPPPSQVSRTESKKSPGYILMQQIIGGGPLLRAIVSVLGEGRGGRDLASAREVAAEVAELHALRSGLAARESSTPSYGGNFRTRGDTTMQAGAPSAAFGEDDGAWWRERCVLTCLSILLAAQEREVLFRDRAREALIGNSAAGINGPAMLSCVSLGDLLADDTRGSPLPAIAQYIEYPYSSAIALLSSRLLLAVSRTIPPAKLLASLRDTGEEARIVGAFVSRLAAGGMASLEVESNEGACVGIVQAIGTTGESDVGFWGIHPRLLGIGLDDSRESCNAGSAVLASLRETLMDILLEHASASTPTLSHLLTGLDGIVRRARGGGPGAATMDERHLLAPPPSGFGAAQNCLQQILLLLAQNPGQGEAYESSVLLEAQCMQLIYRLLSNPVTSAPVLALLQSSSVDFFYSQLSRAFSVAQQGSSPAFRMASRSNAVAWLLRATALGLHAACSGSSPSHPKARRLLNLLFEGSTPNVGSLLDLLLHANLSCQGPAPDRLHASQAIRAATVGMPGPLDVTKNFQCIDVELLHEALKSDPSFSGSDIRENLPQHFRRTLNWAIDYNKYVEGLAALRHLTGAWAQLVEVSVVSCRDVLLMDSESQLPPASVPNLLPSSSVGTAGAGMGDGRGRRVILRILTAALGKINSTVAGASVAPLLLEPIAHACVTAFGALRGQGRPGLAPPPAEGTALLQLLLGAAAGAATGQQGQGSALLRSRLYACLLVHLQLPRLVANGSGLPLAEARLSLLKHRSQYMGSLIKVVHAGSLIVTLGRDACEGPVTLRCVSLSLLAEIISTLETRGAKSMEGIHASQRVLSILCQSGQLQQIVTLVGGAFGADGDTAAALLGASTALLLALASTEAGSRAMVEYGLITRLAEGGVEGSVRNAAGAASAMWLDSNPPQSAQGPSSALALSLELVQATLVALPTNETLVAQVLDFVRRHAKAISHVLRLRTPSLQCLRTAGTAVSILTHISKPPFEALYAERLSKYSDKLSGLVVALLATLARHPYPAWMLPATDRARRFQSDLKNGQRTWWDMLRPWTGADIQNEATPAPSPPGGPGGCEWSQFDCDRLEAGVKTMCHAATFLRIRTVSAPHEAADAASMAECMLACVKVLRACSASETPDGDANAQYDYLAGSMTHILECLLASVFRYVTDSLSKEEKASATAALMPSLEALIHETHPYIKMVARRTEEKLMQQ